MQFVQKLFGNQPVFPHDQMETERRGEILERKLVYKLLFDEGHSAHLFLIGVAYRPDITVQVLGQLIN